MLLQVFMFPALHVSQWYFTYFGNFFTCHPTFPSLHQYYACGFLLVFQNKCCKYFNASEKLGIDLGQG